MASVSMMGRPCDGKKRQNSLFCVSKKEKTQVNHIACITGAVDKTIEVVDPLNGKASHSLQPYAFLPVAPERLRPVPRKPTIRSPLPEYRNTWPTMGRKIPLDGAIQICVLEENGAIELEANPDYFETRLPKLERGEHLFR